MVKLNLRQAIRRSSALLAVLGLAANLVTGCSSDEGGGATGSACNARVDDGDPASGCWCSYDPEDTSTMPQFATKCTAAAVSPRAICCKNSDHCYCAQVGCFLFPSSGSCACSLGYDPAYTSCSPLTVGASRCCESGRGDSCGCDTLGTTCGAVYDDYLTPSCQAPLMPAACDDDEIQVDACE